MSIKSKVLAAAATLTLLGGVGSAGVLTAGAANAETPSCGFFCIDLFSLQFGTHAHPNFLVDTFQQGSRVGQPIILFRISTADPAEDFSVDTFIDTTTFTFYTVDEWQAIDPIFNGNTLVRYGNDFVVENQYAPYGVDSGLCMGVQNTPTDGEGVTLQPCGATTKTLWILDTYPGESFIHGYLPLINGANTNFSDPYVLSYPPNGYPTDMPRPQLDVQTLHSFTQGFPPVASYQLWGADFGEHV